MASKNRTRTCGRIVLARIPHFDKHWDDNVNTPILSPLGKRQILKFAREVTGFAAGYPLANGSNVARAIETKALGPFPV